MATARLSIGTLLIGAGTLILGYGLQVTLLPIRAQVEGFSNTTIGVMGTAAFAGYAIGCLIGPSVVMRVGHIRCFAGFAALCAAGALAFPLSVDPIAWTALRAFTGMCLAILYLVIESWLNEMTTNRTRGMVLSLYIIVANLVTIGGQLMVNLYDVQDAALFSLIAILICLSLVPLSLTTTAAPKPISSGKIRIGWLFRLSPAGFLGCFVVGLSEGAFWSLAPVFAQGRGLSVADVTFFMSAFMVGGTISQWPLGWLSDKIDRRFVIAGAALGTVGTGLVIAYSLNRDLNFVLGLAALHGAFMFPLYPLCLAHANDYAPNHAMVEVSSGLLLLYAVGAALGPLFAAPLMDRDLGLLFVFIVVMLGVLALFNLYRSFRRPIGEIVERVDFVPVTKTTQALYELEQDDVEEEEAPAATDPG